MFNPYVTRNFIFEDNSIFNRPKCYIRDSMNKHCVYKSLFCDHNPNEIELDIISIFKHYISLQVIDPKKIYNIIKLIYGSKAKFFILNSILYNKNNSIFNFYYSKLEDRNKIIFLEFMLQKEKSKETNKVVQKEPIKIVRKEPIKVVQKEKVNETPKGNFCWSTFWSTFNKIAPNLSENRELYYNFILLLFSLFCKNESSCLFFKNGLERNLKEYLNQSKNIKRESEIVQSENHSSMNDIARALSRNKQPDSLPKYIKRESKFVNPGSFPLNNQEKNENPVIAPENTKKCEFNISFSEPEFFSQLSKSFGLFYQDEKSNKNSLPEEIPKKVDLQFNQSESHLHENEQEKNNNFDLQNYKDNINLVIQDALCKLNKPQSENKQEKNSKSNFGLQIYKDIINLLAQESLYKLNPQQPEKSESVEKENQSGGDFSEKLFRKILSTVSEKIVSENIKEQDKTYSLDLTEALKVVNSQFEKICNGKEIPKETTNSDSTQSEEENAMKEENNDKKSDVTKNVSVNFGDFFKILGGRFHKNDENSQKNEESTCKVEEPQNATHIEDLLSELESKIDDADISDILNRVNDC